MLLERFEVGASKSLIQKFLSTSGERLTEFGELLSTLNRVQERDDVVRRLARDLHTYKGESRLLGLEEIERLAHRAEELLQVLIAAPGASAPHQRLLLEAIDLLREGVNRRLNDRLPPVPADDAAQHESDIPAIFAHFAPFLREVGQESSKSVKLSFVGDSRTLAPALGSELLERVSEAALHVLRNAIVHGIETEAERVAQGKPPTGQIQIRCTTDAHRIQLEFCDDGRGLDLERIRQRADELGVCENPQTLSVADASALVFRSGFSTVRAPHALAGLGIGLDVVRHILEAAGGQVAVRSDSGRGCAFEFSLPRQG